jgi:hypothetical protein
MLTPLLLSLTALPAPAASSAPPVLPAATRQGVSIGCNKPRCLSRRKINRQIEDIGGFPLVDAHRACIDWIALRGEAEVQLGEAEGRGIGTAAIHALAMLGTGGNVQAGVARFPLRFSLSELRRQLDEETGAFGDPERPDYLLDQALSVLVFSEAYYSDDKPKRMERAVLAAQALLAGRGEDGLWHVDGEPDGPVDALVTSLSAYALYSAYEAGLGLPVEASEPILEWTAMVAEQAAQAGDGELGRDEALTYAGALVARLFSAQVLERSLSEDAIVSQLSARVAAQIPEAPSPDAELSVPPRLDEVDFTFLASLGLFQADNAAWGRCQQWTAAILLHRHQRLEDEEALGCFPAGDTGRLPGGRLGTTALRALCMQSGVREHPLPVVVN